MERRIQLGEMSWTDVEAALRDGFETVIIPTGSVEQHGPHLPLLTDSLIAERVAELTARKLGKTLVAPVIRPGLSYHHMQFPGSFTVTPETFRRLLEEYCLSLATHGFRTFIVTSGHGGNFSFIDGIGFYLQDYSRSRGHPVRVIPHVDAAEYARIQREFVCQQFGVPPEEANWHADVLETACMLAIRPDLVHMERAVPGWVGDSKDIDLYAKDLRSLTPNGILGDPRRATREMGEALLEYVSDWMAGQLRRRLGWVEE